MIHGLVALRFMILSIMSRRLMGSIIMTLGKLDLIKMTQHSNIYWHTQGSIPLTVIHAVTNTPFIMSVIKWNVVMLSVKAPSN